VPGMFSYQAYHGSFLKDSILIANQLANEEGWVLGLPQADRVKQLDLKAREALIAEVRRLYLTDYAETWSAFVDDIRLLRGGGMTQTITQARILAAQDSPLRKLLQAIIKEVTLIKVDDADKSITRKAEDVISKTKDTVGRLMSGPQRAAAPTGESQLRPEVIVDDRFTALRDYVKGSAPGQPAPIDATLSLIGELYTQLTAAELALKSGSPPPQGDLPIKAKAEAGRLPEPAKSLLSTLAVAGQTQGLGAMRENLSKDLRGSITDFCLKALSGRYPLVKSSTSNVTQEDFSRVFGAGGLMDDFFQKRLASLVDIGTNPWRFRQVGDASLGGSGALSQFQRAQTIRDVFFRGGPAAGLRLDFKPLSMDVSISQFVLDVDGQIVKYSHGPQVPQPVQWPGPRGSTQVRIQLTPPALSGGLGPFEGPWALFRMFDQVKIEATAQPEKFLASFTIDGRNAQFEVTTSSVRNPFRLPELEQFQCPGGL
jgi:type VI secretion system protein ImpL